MEMQPQRQPVETHEQFYQRASQILQMDAGFGRTLLERAVFSHLMARLIDRHGYAGISDKMLHAAGEDMQQIVRRYFSLPSRLSH